MSAGFHRPTSHGTVQNHVDSSNAQVQNVKSAKVYVFGDADLAQDEMEINTDNTYEMSELRPRGRTRQQLRTADTQEDNEDIFIEHKIEDGDTLQNISLKYGCQVIYFLMNSLSCKVEMLR